MTMRFFILIQFIFIATVAAQTCHPDWILFQERCYGFGEEPLTWGDAAVMCRSFDAKLAEIETGEENNFLKNISNTKHEYIFWLGGTDIFHEGTWRWVTTRELIYSFTDWAPGQPNESDDPGQDCLGLQQDMGYHWNDVSCSAVQYFICEANPADEPVVG